ncbi:NmrA-like family protein [Colletotrichum graminicola]|uniref:NmrA-like family protein n=1 Tax=Colletotrichum graminicola (strain M1.001 / M2 / FGSC 10212) TaxID=645133 RepID=E3QUD2_COLGM|nr:NmrA-like family protein [Colletotrichum graminicola M1.001]EFQ34470.1 NmrA-like family protein [Colletotrichum graminicola M1.001]WDK08822.1 NmrA-like family protein [Colletotrichum graminicola]
MPSSTKKTLVVLGATGNQGGSVARTFLSDPALAAEWHVRGFTRNASSVPATELSRLGAEMVSGSVDSVAELKAAFDGATAIFAVTDFWTAYGTEKVANRVRDEGVDRGAATRELEELWGRNIAQAAAETQSLERFVFSSLPPVLELSQGKLRHVHHLDSKTNIVRQIEQEHPALWAKTSQIMVACYCSNMLPGSFFGPKRNEETGNAEFEGPNDIDTPIPLIDPTVSTGPFFKTLLLDEPVGTVLAAYDELKSYRDIIKVLHESTRHRFVYVQRSVDGLAAASPLGLESPESWLWIAEYGLFGEKVAGWKDSIKFPADLSVKVQTPSVETWLKQQDWSLSSAV